ncbi:MAG: MFS transporter [Pseudomonadota bacterium]
MTAVAAAPPRALMPVLCALAIAGYVGSFLYLPALPQVAAEFGASEAGAQATLTIFFVGTCLGFAVYGPISDRIGRRRTLAATGALFVLACLMCAGAASLSQLMVARFLLGFGAVAGVTTARAAIRSLWPAEKAPQMMAFLSASMAIAPAASPVVGALALEWVAWRTTFLGAGIFAAMVLLVAIVVLPKMPLRPKGEGSLSRDLWALAASPVYRATVLIGASSTGLFLVMMAGSPFIFVGLWGLSPLHYSLIQGAILLAYASFALVGANVVRRFGTLKTMAFGLLPALGAAVILALCGVLEAGVILIAPALFMIMASMGMIVPGSQILMLEPFPQIASTAASLGLLATTLGGALAVTVYGVLASGSETGFAVAIAGLTALTAFGYALLPERRAAR